MPDAGTALGVLTIELDELAHILGQSLLDDYMACLGIHDAETVFVLAVNVSKEFVRETGGGRLFN
jgi:hypothetical protein